MRGLLPEGAHLLAVATTARVPTNYYADLLARYGRDIAGAFTISVGEPDERRWAVEPDDDEHLAAELRSVAESPGFAIRDDSELSIAGLQNKLLVCALDGKYDDMTRDDFVSEGHLYRHAPTGAERLMDNLAHRLAAAAAACSDDRVASLVTERLRTLEH